MDKLTKQELKTPDEIWKVSRSALDWMMEHIVSLLAVLSVILIGLIVGIYLYQGKIKREGLAEFELAKSKALFEQWKVDATALKPADPKAAAASPEKKPEEIEAELTSSLAKIDKDFGSSKTNRLADLIRAKVALKKNDTAKAIELLDRYKTSLPKADQNLGLFPLAGLYEESGNWEKAAQTYDQILNIKKSGFEELATLGKARALKRAGKLDDAIAAYRGFIEKFKSSQEIGSARALLAEALDARPQTAAPEAAPATKK